MAAICLSLAEPLTALLLPVAVLLGPRMCALQDVEPMLLSPARSLPARTKTNLAGLERISQLAMASAVCRSRPLVCT